MATKPSAPQLVIAFVVLAVWVATLMVRIIRPGAAGEFGVVDTAILLIIGFLFSANAIRRNGNGNGNGKTPKGDGQ